MLAAKPGLSAACGESACDALLEPDQIVARVLPGEQVVGRIEQDALLAARIVDDAARELRAVAQRTTNARTEFVP